MLSENRERYLKSIFFKIVFMIDMLVSRSIFIASQMHLEVNIVLKYCTSVATEAKIEQLVTQVSNMGSWKEQASEEWHR